MPDQSAKAYVQAFMAKHRWMGERSDTLCLWNAEWGSQGKACFFKKKQQKTFDCSGFGRSEKALLELIKVFWFFFSKKNCFLPASVGTSGVSGSGGAPSLHG